MHLSHPSSGGSAGWFIIPVIAIIIFFHWLAMGAHKSAIRTEVYKLKAKLINIRWLPFEGGGDKNDTFYEVTMVLPSGRRVNALCKCNMWHGVYWKSTPWAEELLREPAPKNEFDPSVKPMRVVADCATCGYGLQQGWVACPNCGTDVAS
jgi:hypothetical protein